MRSSNQFGEPVEKGPLSAMGTPGLSSVINFSSVSPHTFKCDEVVGAVKYDLCNLGKRFKDVVTPY